MLVVMPLPVVSRGYYLLVDKPLPIEKLLLASASASESEQYPRLQIRPNTITRPKPGSM